MLFFTETIQGDYFSLEDQEFRHCTTVMRKKEGDSISATNGKGIMATGNIITISKKGLTVKIDDIQNIENKFSNICLAIAPTKNHDRMEWLVEKATEIGVGKIIFIETEKSERIKINFNRLEANCISALKQSKQAWKPILDFQKFNAFIDNSNVEQLLIAHCKEDESKIKLSEVKHLEKTIILIGPEGDFSSKEIEKAKANNAITISLGDSRLRTETAGIVSLCIWNFNI